MVIVKFLSESDCDLYIDTEFFCAVSANLIRKIELEVGSYLIEALDAEGKKSVAKFLILNNHKGKYSYNLVRVQLRLMQLCKNLRISQM